MSWLGDLIWDLFRKGDKHRRKRAPGDEDHFYPVHPEKHSLVMNQCYHCGEILPGRPKRGCRRLIQQR